MSGERKFKGTITVFLTLSLTIVISLIAAVIASARDRSMRMRCETAMDLGLLSVFGEYNRELLSQFDLYFIDSAYGGQNGSSYYTAERLKDYMQYNLNPAKGQILPFSRDLFALKADDVDVKMESLATDSGMRVYKRQAIRYVKDRFGMSVIEGMKKTEKEYKQYRIDELDPDAERQKELDKMERAGTPEDEEGNPVEVENPVKKIDDQREGVIEFLLGEVEVSEKGIDTSSLASNRNLKSGDGIVANTEDLDSVVNNLLFDFYLLDKFQCYTNDLGKKSIDYELEYIINGKDNDRKNLSLVVSAIQAVRYGANAMHALQSEMLKPQAEGAAAVVSAVLLSPELEEPLTNIILFAWSFAETCVDVKTLLKGGKVPIMKDDETWVLKSLPMALAYKSHLDEGTSVEKGISYESYLMLFLMLEGSEKKLKRSVDLIECVLRNSPGNESFRMDNCIEFLEVEARVRSRFGREYEIDRYFGYADMPKRDF